MNIEANSPPLILAVSARKLNPAVSATGFHPMKESDTLGVLNHAGLWLGERPTLELDPSFRQIIPYILLRYEKHYVRYTRTPSGGENRLHGRQSIGLGGHTDLEDLVHQNSVINLKATLNKTAAREVFEELGPVNILNKEWIGLLSDTTNEVGKVHIGAVGIWDLSSLPKGKSEDAIGEVEICSIEDIQANASRLETWSELLLPELSRSY